MRKLCKGVWINGDHQNGAEIGSERMGKTVAEIEEIACFESDKGLIDREYRFYDENDNLIMSFINLPVLVYYLQEATT